MSHKKDARLIRVLYIFVLGSDVIKTFKLVELFNSDTLFLLFFYLKKIIKVTVLIS